MAPHRSIHACGVARREGGSTVSELDLDFARIDFTQYGDQAKNLTVRCTLDACRSEITDKWSCGLALGDGVRC
jgi:hypothetical protein